MNLAAAAKSAMTESRFLPACIDNSDTPREATTQRSIKDVPEMRFQSTDSVVDSDCLAKALVSSSSPMNFSTLRASGDRIAAIRAGSEMAASNSSSVGSSSSSWALRSDRLSRSSESASSPQASDRSNCSAWVKVIGSSDRHTAANCSNCPAA